MPGESPLSGAPIGGAAAPTTGTGAFSLGIGCGCCGGDLDVCQGCGIPQVNLTVDWVNTIFGNGSIVMPRTGLSSWSKNCGVGTVFADYGIFCFLGFGWVFRIHGFGFGCGSPPTSTNDTRTAPPNQIISDVLKCGSSFDWTAHVTAASCPDLWTLGFVSWDIHL